MRGGKLAAPLPARKAVPADETGPAGALAAVAAPVLPSPGVYPSRGAVIYQPCRSAMSSGGKAARPVWVLAFAPESPSLPDPLMGWSSSADTRAQIRLEFPSCEEAVAYARRKGIAATVAAPHRPKPMIRSYASNFIGQGAVGVAGRVGRPDDGWPPPAAT